MFLFFCMGCMPHVVPVRVTAVNTLFKKIEKKLNQVFFTCMKHNKSHDRAADKMGFSIALKRSLVAEIERLAESEGRNRNQQIVWMLGESLAMRAERRISEMVRPASTLREVPVPKKPKRNFTPDPDIQAGASTETGKRIMPKEDRKSA